jgi:hypothetical protein
MFHEITAVDNHLIQTIDKTEKIARKMKIRCFHKSRWIQKESLKQYHQMVTVAKTLGCSY